VFLRSKFANVVLGALTLIAISLNNSSSVAQGVVCTPKNLENLMNTDLSILRKEKLDVNFGRAMGGADINAYYVGQSLSAVTASFKSSAGTADMNFFFQSRSDYLMEYHIMQNSNFYGEQDSVLLTNEKSYYHVCDDTLLAPAFGGIIDDDIYQNMKLVLDVILTEEAAQ
jgi:hypothetical protein